MTDRQESLPIKSLIMGPALVTLAVTLLRLVGELQNWSPRFFSREPGGAGAVVGIVWLAPLFGIYFAMKLARLAPPASTGKALGNAALGTVVGIAIAFGGGALLKGNQTLQFLVGVGGVILGAVIAYRGWPALGKTLLAYGLAARIPVIIVMLVAMIANWGTHYDALPPNFPAMGTFAKWFMAGVIPQLFAWIPFTIFSGALFGSAAVALTGKARQPVTA
jgi:hypothetical protein